MAGLEKPLRLSYFADKERVYRHVADLLIRQGRLSEAQQAVSLLKEEEDHYFLDTQGVGIVPVEGVAATIAEHHWIEDIADFDSEQGRVGHEIERLQTENRRLDLSGEEMERLLQTIDRADKIKKAFKAYLAEIEAVFLSRGGVPAIEFGRKDVSNLKRLQGAL